MNNCHSPNTNSNNRTLWEQLNHYFDRGYYSVVKNSGGSFIIFSTKDNDGYFRVSLTNLNLRYCKNYIGMSIISKEGLGMIDGAEIVELIHPSSLMGGTFRLGDKVKVIRGDCDDDVGRIGIITQVDDDQPKFKVQYDDTNYNYDFYDADELELQLLPEQCDHCQSHQTCSSCMSDEQKKAAAIKTLTELGALVDGKVLQ